MIDNHLYDIKRKLPKYVDLGGGRNYYVHLEGREDFLGVEVCFGGPEWCKILHYKST